VLVNLADIDLADLRKLTVAERLRLLEMIQASIDEERPPSVPSEPGHRRAVLDELRRFREDGVPGEPAESVLENLRRRL